MFAAASSRRMAKGRCDPNGAGFLRGTVHPQRRQSSRTPEQLQLTYRRTERTKRANEIRRLVEWIAKPPTETFTTSTIQDSALPFWRDDVLYEKVRKLVRIVRDEWQWLEKGEF